VLATRPLGRGFRRRLAQCVHQDLEIVGFTQHILQLLETTHQRTR